MMGESWSAELARPTEGFFNAFAACAMEPEGARDATREAVKFLIPAVDWAGCLPHLPTGLLGTWGVWRLQPLLAEGSFLRLLAVQLHAFARESRRPKGGLSAISKGSGNWANLEAGIASRRPSLAYGEALGMAEPRTEDFLRLLRHGAADMACTGLKGSSPWFLGDLWERLDRPRATGRRLLAVSAWLVAAEPADRFWNQRARTRLGEVPAIGSGPAILAQAHREIAREVCDLGLVALLDGFCGRIRDGATSTDLLSALTLAAAEKLLDARRDLEGKTSGTLTYLAALARGLAPMAQPEPFAQAAALVNLFPSDEAEERIRPKPPGVPVAEAAAGLLDAILDAEPAQAMQLAQRLETEQGAESLLSVLAEAVSRNDPAFNHSGQVLAVAGAAELVPFLTAEAVSAMLVALAKSLANSQGSGDLGRRADRALACG
jgi:hypothetical protein